MGAKIQPEEGNLTVLRITGLLRKAELDAVQKAEAGRWDPATRIKLLVIVEKFEGWERNVDWGDMTFFLKHGNQIEKMAVVADPRWKDELLMFAGAGFRKAQVKFFSPGQLATARAWLG
jgi:hypothetical protein